MRRGSKKKSKAIVMLTMQLGTLGKYIQLTKAFLCFMVSLSAAFGYLIVSPVVTSGLLLMTGGVFFLACGAAGLNSIQERVSDGAFTRTQNRPLVTGALSVQTALVIVGCCIFSGSLLLFLCSPSLIPLSIGVLTLVIYNGVYTPLKPLSEFALILGGISGALPPLIGWVAAGGVFGDPVILIIMALLFLWQPPHFLLIVLAHKNEYRKRQVFSNLIQRVSPLKVKKIIAVWLSAFITLVFFLGTVPGLLNHSTKTVLFTVTPIFLFLFLIHLFTSKAPRYKLLFVSLNSFLLVIMALFTIGTATLSTFS